MVEPHYPKAVWGFNGTERPGAVYLAAVLAAHTQKGDYRPSASMQRCKQDATDNTIPKDVEENCSVLFRTAQAVATMRGRHLIWLFEHLYG